jgi:ribosomal protein S18 acetylase RimI-like enzyme
VRSFSFFPIFAKIGMIEIIDYCDEYASDFRELNLEWLEKYHLTESHDLEIINHPREVILDGGGYIFLAKSGDKIVGTAGLAKAANGIYELVKMTVAPAFQGKGISRMLMDHCLSKAKQLNAKKLFLYSNSQLTTAISLYRKYGFEHVDATKSPLITADIKMELSL